MAARVQHPAPHFKGLAVVGDGFEGKLCFARKTRSSLDANGCPIEISLDDFKGKWLVLGFIPMAWTFVW